MRVAIVAFGASLVLRAGFTLAADDVAHLMRQCRAGKEKDCRKLGQIARTHPDAGTRAEATSYLDDPALLADVALRDPSPTVRVTALHNRRMTDTSVRTQIVRDRAADAECRRIAILGITDEGVLMEVIKADPADPLAQQAVSLLNAPLSLLAAAFATPPTSAAHETALRGLQNLVPKITDQAVLTQIARAPVPPGEGYAFEMLQRPAVEKIVDPEVLAAIALESFIVGRTAVGRVTDEKQLANIARDAADPEVSRRAIRKVTDAAALDAVARSGKHPGVRAAALLKAKTPDAVLQNDVLLHVMREKQWDALYDLAALKIRLSPESTAALKTLAGEQDERRANIARAMLAGVPRAAWPYVRLVIGLSVREIPSSTRLAPGAYTFHTTYRDVVVYKTESTGVVPLTTTLQAGKCYKFEGVTRGMKWGPRLEAETCQ